MTFGNNPPSPEDQLRAAGLRAKKSWGQNFLKDESILHDIAEATGAGPQHPVIELGAGLGALTHHLLLLGGTVIAVERDREIVPALTERFVDHPALEIMEADAARLDYAALADRLGQSLIVAGNLPYQLSGRIMVSLADAVPFIARAVLLVQKEVAERLVAPPGSKTYGLLSVLVQRSFHARAVRHVPPSAFHPRPKVDSMVVSLERLSGDKMPWLQKDPAMDAALVRVARAAFSSRRKTLRNALSAGLQRSPAEVEQIVRSCGIDPNCRAETLSVASFATLGAALM